MISDPMAPTSDFFASTRGFTIPAPPWPQTEMHDATELPIMSEVRGPNMTRATIISTRRPRSSCRRLLAPAGPTGHFPLGPSALRRRSARSDMTAWRVLIDGRRERGRPRCRNEFQMDLLGNAHAEDATQSTGRKHITKALVYLCNVHF
jgi:hypothetical protein